MASSTSRTVQNQAWHFFPSSTRAPRWCISLLGSMPQQDVCLKTISPSLSLPSFKLIYLKFGEEDFKTTTLQVTWGLGFLYAHSALQIFLPIGDLAFSPLTKPFLSPIILSDILPAVTCYTPDFSKF